MMTTTKIIYQYFNYMVYNSYTSVCRSCTLKPATIVLQYFLKSLWNKMLHRWTIYAVYADADNEDETSVVRKFMWCRVICSCDLHY